MNSNYLLESPDFVSIQNEIADIIKKTNFSSSAISTYDLEESTLEKALEDLDTYSFLTEKKIIIIKNIETINQDENKKDIEHLYKYLKSQNPDNLLIITSKKLNNTYKITKELKKLCTYIETTINPTKLIKEELKEYKLDNGVVNLLLEYCKEDITKLKNECLKLKNYKYKEKSISEEDIEELCIEKLGDATNLTFAFARSLGERNKKDALKKYKELLNYNIEPLTIVGLLASQLRIMYQVKTLIEKNMTNNEIADTLKEKPFRITKTKELLQYYTKSELLNLITKLSTIDLQIKTTDSNPNALIELFILNI